MARIAILVYGVICYAIFLAAFAYGIGFIGGFVTPTMLDGQPALSIKTSLTIDLALLGVFAVQHSGMARAGFKAWLTRFVPAAAERSTYVLLSSVALIVLFVWWKPIGGVVWDVAAPTARNLVILFYLFGWLLLLYATFLIDHFDLFGLKQVWRQLTRLPYRTPQFHTPGLYRLVRHPIYIGWLIIFWAAPTMTVAHLVFAVATTAYILIAIQLEERDLVAAFGDDYVAYRQRTPMLIPRLWPGRQSAKKETSRSYN